MQRHNTEDPEHVCYARGFLQPMTMAATPRVAGVDAVRTWQWLGRLPAGVNPDSGGTWTVKANAKGKDREWNVDSAVETTHWQLQLTETT